MEYLMFALVAFGFIVVLMISGWIHEKRQEKKFVAKLRADYGILPKREYTPEQYAGISHYFARHRDGFIIDDITWNDLEMDEIFRRMNHTWSSAGEEYLYYALRTPLTSENDLIRRETVITYFQHEEAQRVTWQLLFAKLGRTGKYSLYNYLGYLDQLGTRSNMRHFLSIAAMIAAIAAVTLSPAVGITLVFIALTYNLTSYYRVKKDIEPYIISFSYIFRLLDSVKAMERNQVPVLKEQIAEMARCRTAFARFRRGSYLLMSPARMSASSNPLEVVLDYLRMGLHLDLIKFNQMLAQVRQHTGEIDRMLTIAGSVEAMIAIGAWREGLKRNGAGYCVPQFLAEKRIAGKGIYHPLLAEPVKNDLDIGHSVLLTGSNASGKSTFLKAVALNAIMAQTVHTCLANSYRTAMFLTASSMSLRDDILGGESYYMAEIRAMKRLLDLCRTADIPVLVLVDEVLRGTNTVERIAASTQILRSLDGENSLCFAATHDVELTHLLEAEYENYHFEEVFTEGDIYFPYILKSGRATTRNAIRLLKAMGYDPGLVDDAEQLAEVFSASGKWQNGYRPLSADKDDIDEGGESWA